MLLQDRSTVRRTPNYRLDRRDTLRVAHRRVRERQHHDTVDQAGAVGVRASQRPANISAAHTAAKLVAATDVRAHLSRQGLRDPDQLAMANAGKIQSRMPSDAVHIGASASKWAPFGIGSA
jgi:hypothetical protein